MGSIGPEVEEATDHGSAWEEPYIYIELLPSPTSRLHHDENLLSFFLKACVIFGNLLFFLDMNAQYSKKGKEKVLSGYAFNEDGLLSSEVIKIIDSGKLKSVSKAFGKTVLDMDREIFEGVFVKDVLDSAIKGTLDDLLSQVQPKKPKQKALKIGTDTNVSQAAEIQGCARLAEDPHMELMEVEEVMIEMALYQELEGGGNMA
ncbi:hypothetical protein POM88_032299 [Heracleum sosnowskyi]|uniref:Uncharacterized protein n=1 Tax=Heracleum sosnowskyi TaxID=360622 RepID=A0AAD8I0A2_9APIA|nr:hypothetical protein POM88_032299 [Heracleum sosnowskyi]